MNMTTAISFARAFRCHFQKVFFCCFVLLWAGLSGCGGDDGISERLSGPGANSALPIQIDATVTPAATASPETGESVLEGATPEAAQSVTPNAEPEASPSPTTVSPDASPSPQPAPTALPSPSPTAKPSPTPSSPATPKSLDAVPTDTPTPSEQEESDSSVTGHEKRVEKPQPRVQEAEPTLDEDEQEEEPSFPLKTPYGVVIDKLAVCAKLADRNPSQIADEFSLAKVRKLYTWMRVSGVKPPKKIKHIYYRNGKVVAVVTLTLKYASMRTWSQKTLKPQEALGDWKVLITTEDSKQVLASKEFTIVP